MRRPPYPGWHYSGMEKKMPEHTMMPGHKMYKPLMPEPMMEPEPMLMPEPMMVPEPEMMPMAEEMPAECMCEVPVCGQVLAHSYVPWQQYCRAFSPREALMKGTLFPELFGVYPIPK